MSWPTSWASEAPSETGGRELMTQSNLGGSMGHKVAHPLWSR